MNFDDAQDGYVLRACMYVGCREANRICTRTINYVVFGFKFHTFMKTWHVLNLMRFPFCTLSLVRYLCLASNYFMLFYFIQFLLLLFFCFFFVVSSRSYDLQTYRMNLFNQCQWYRHHRKSFHKGRLNSKWNRIFNGILSILDRGHR